MDPFRDNPFACPACEPRAGLREFQDRLVCDTCTGIFVDAADLGRELESLAGVEVALEYVKEKQGSRACPRCAQPMATCKLRVVIPVYEEHPTTPPTLDRCEAHGLWFDAEELARVFAVISRLTGGGGGGSRGGTMRPGAGRGWGFG